MSAATEAGNTALLVFAKTLSTYSADDQFYVGFVRGQLLAIEMFMQPDASALLETRQAMERWQRAAA